MRGLLCSLVLLLGSISGFARAQVFLSEYARMGLDAMEQDRPGMCMEYYQYKVDLAAYIEGADPEKLISNMDYVEWAKHQDEMELRYYYYCGIENMKFYAPAMKEACQPEEFKEFPLCEAYSAYLLEETNPNNFRFAEDLEAIYDEINFIDWEFISVPENPVIPFKENAFLGIGKGNLLFELKVPILELEKDHEHLKTLEEDSYLSFSTFELQLQNKILVPVLQIFLIPIGVSDTSYLLEINFIFHDGKEMKKEVLQEPNLLQWDQPFYKELLLTKDLIEQLSRAEEIEALGYYPDDEEGKNIFVIKLQNNDFLKIFETYIEHLNLMYPSSPDFDS